MRKVAAMVALAALAACGSKEAKKPEGGSFQEVLPGSASDAMLPYDTATSAPPLAPDQYEGVEDQGGPAAKPRVPAASESAAEAETAPEVEPT